MPSLRFFGGVREIGGNKILLEDGDFRVWFDFGQTFDMGCDFFTSWLQPRVHNGLGDFFEFDLLPKIEGLYAERLLLNSSLEYKPPAFDAFFISHAHYDHVGHISFLDSSIPVWCGAGAKLFMEAAEVTSSFQNFGEHDYRTFRTGDKIRMGPLVVEPIHVDHSIPSAYGFIVYTSAGAMVYTGDIRHHGPKQEMTDEFITTACDSEPIAMISEGTRMVKREKRKNLSESQVLKGVKKVCSEADRQRKLVVYTHNVRDTDRFATFYTAARDYGRQVVVTPRAAHLLKRLVEDQHLALPDPSKDDSISVYFRKKRSGKYQEKDYFHWERSFLDKMVTAANIHNHPADYILKLDFNHLTELIDIRPEAGSHFIYSKSEPFSEDDIEEKVMHNWLDHFGLHYHQLHASGHMNLQELVETIETIKPKAVFPVHTENPQLFKTYHKNVVSVNLGETYDI